MLNPVHPVHPVALRPGDQVALVSPASPCDPARVARGTELLRGWGLDVRQAAPRVAPPGYLAGSDAERLAELNAALRDPAVRGVFCTRGGYGTQRIVDGVDAGALTGDPKVVAGFSDVTALHLALRRRCGLVTFYGPGIAWDDERLGAGCAQALRRAVMDPRYRPVLRPDPAEPTAALRVAGPPVHGPLVGGNLSLLAASTGTPDQPQARGAVLLLEDVGEAPYRVDRMLTQLRRACVFAGVSGVAVGQFTGCGERGGGPGVVDVLGERLGDLGVPVLGGFPVGHGPGQVTVPLNVDVELDTAAGTLSFTEPAVRSQ